MTANPHPAAIGRLECEWRALACAVTFLTRLPFPGASHTGDALARSATYFPVVGLLVAGIGSGAYLVGSAWWPQPVAVLLAIGAMLLATGGFHEDGLADTADGLGGGWRVEDKLRIMKDSRLGSYGALALVMALLLKFTLLCALAPGAVPAALVLGQVLGRWSCLPLVRYTNYVGGSAGTGRPLLPGVTLARLALATGFSLACVVLLHPGALLPLLLALAAVTFLWRRHCRRQLGGITGDTLGAGKLLAELAVYLVLAAGAGS